VLNHLFSGKYTIKMSFPFYPLTLNRKTHFLAPMPRRMHMLNRIAGVKTCPIGQTGRNCRARRSQDGAQVTSQGAVLHGVWAIYCVET
jgi:hypothetical protein